MKASIQKQFGVCTSDAVFQDSMESARKVAADLLKENPEKTIFITEVVSKVSMGLKWETKKPVKNRKANAVNADAVEL